MRVPALTALALGVFAATSAQAQIYDPAYPVCLQVFGRFSHFECGYTSIEQCRPSAVARAAQCVVNPYYAGSEVAPRVRHRHHRRAY
jgi:hypothetical protein